MIKTLLWDVDGTLLDFLQAEKYGMRKCLAEIGVELTDGMLECYSAINRSWWEKLERGEATRRDVFVERLREFFARYDIVYDDYDRFNARYQEALGEAAFPIDNCIALFEKLKPHFRMYFVTNGSKRAQELKLAKSGLDRYADGIFISEVVGHQKPSKAFFDVVKERTGYAEEETLIIGDSLSSDMQGGNNAGILCCWYNPKEAGRNGDVRIDYEIKNLWDLCGILGIE